MRLYFFSTVGLVWQMSAVFFHNYIAIRIDCLSASLKKRQNLFTFMGVWGDCLFGGRTTSVCCPLSMCLHISREGGCTAKYINRVLVEKLS